MERCFVCRAELLLVDERESIRRSTTRERQTHLLEKQIEVFFLITKLMDIPLEVCADFISANGNPSVWISYCKKCSLMLKRYRETYNKLLKFQNDFNLAKEQLKLCIRTANDVSTHDIRIEKDDVKWVSDYILNLFLSREDLTAARDHQSSLTLYESDAEEIIVDCIKKEKDDNLSSGIEDNDVNGFDINLTSEVSLSPNTANSDSISNIDTEDFKGEIDFKCKYCGMNFKYKTTMMYHVRRFHTEELATTCEKCGEWFPDRKGILNHFAIAHPGCIPKKRKRKIRNNNDTNEEFKCEYCQMYFKHKTSMIIHIRRFHTKEPTVACEKCGEKFPHRRDILLHYTKAHPNDIPEKTKRKLSNNGSSEEFKCKYCQMDFKHKTTMKRHVRRFHTKEPTVECENCGVWFPDRKDVLEHFAIAHPNDIQKRQKAIRKDPSEKFNCQYCGTEFKYKSTMMRHVRRIHTKERTHACEKCGEWFSDRRDVLKHFAVAHPDDTPKKRMARPRKKVKAPQVIICEICGGNFKENSQYKAHMRSHTGDKPHLCELCSERCFSVTALTWHKHYAHYKELDLEPFQCKECGKFLRSPPALKYHMTAHHGNKDVKCEICGEGFVDKYKLGDHIKIQHEKQRNFECKDCGRKFPRKPSLEAHMQKHTGVFDHVCKICQKGFAFIAYLKRHMKYHSSDFPHKRKSRLSQNVNVNV